MIYMCTNRYAASSRFVILTFGNLHLSLCRFHDLSLLFIKCRLLSSELVKEAKESLQDYLVQVIFLANQLITLIF
jgi:hypothetical protein